MTATTASRKLAVSDDDLALINGAFGGKEGPDEDLIIAVRDLLFGFDINPSEKKVIASIFSDGRLVAAIQRKLFPMLTPGVPIGEEQDFWMGTEHQIMDKAPSTIEQVIGYKKLALEYLEQGFKLLQDPDGPKVLVHYDPRTDNDPLHCKLIARNLYLQTVKQGMLYVKLIAGRKQESLEDIKKRLSADSSK